MGLVVTVGWNVWVQPTTNRGKGMNEFKYKRIDNGKYKYELTKDYIYRTNRINNLFAKQIDKARLDIDGTITIKKGYQWDGATGAIDRVKRIFRLGVRKKIIRASCVHDSLCDLIAQGQLHIVYRKSVDQVFRDICIQDEMSWARQVWTYYGIRLFVKLKYGWYY